MFSALELTQISLLRFYLCFCLTLRYPCLLAFQPGQTAWVYSEFPLGPCRPVAGEQTKKQGGPGCDESQAFQDSTAEPGLGAPSLLAAQDLATLARLVKCYCW